MTSARRLFARLWRGRRARDLVDRARRDLAAMPLPDAVNARCSASLPRPRRALALRATAASVGDTLRGETHPCLLRSLALFEEARACGFDVRLSIGVRRDGGGPLESHAWLVEDGEPFLERHEGVEPYRTITVLP